MKENRLVFTLLLLLSAPVFQLPAQQNEADRKLLAEIRARAEIGDAQSQFELGAAFHFGTQGVAKDYAEAVKWYRKAAEQNYARAQFNLGVSYAKGEGVAKNYVEGYKWVVLAAAQGDELGKTAVTILENEMSWEQIAEGQKLARNFKPREVPSDGGDSSSTGIVQSRPESSGTGFFITDDGYLITNEHVAGNGAQVRLVTVALAATPVL
jgi:TPR repeat protein